MLKLYIKSECPYSLAALHKLEALGIPFQELNITNTDALAELLEKGGKRQVPFLIDDEKKLSIYESNDIIDYLDTYYNEHPHLKTKLDRREGEVTATSF